MLERIAPKGLSDVAKWASATINELLLFGKQNQSICARLYEAECHTVVKCIDIAFGERHCRRASIFYQKWVRDQRRK